MPHTKYFARPLAHGVSESKPPSPEVEFSLSTIVSLQTALHGALLMSLGRHPTFFASELSPSWKAHPFTHATPFPCLCPNTRHSACGTQELPSLEAGDGC